MKETMKEKMKKKASSNISNTKPPFAKGVLYRGKHSTYSNKSSFSFLHHQTAFNF